MAKYIFGILACAFLALGFTHISNKELQGFQKETGVPAIDMSYNEGANCCISSAGFDKSCKETHSLLTDGTYGSKVSDCIFDNLSFPRSIVPFKNLRFYTTNTAILQILSSLNTMLPEKRLSHTCFDVNYTKYSCKYYVYTLAHILI